MRKILLFSILALSFACNSEDDTEIITEVDNSGLSMLPEAKIEFNDSNFGIYKGVCIGPSGTIKIDLFNSADATATLIINGVTYVFTCAETVVLNEDINGITFTSGNNSFEMMVSGAGLNPQITNIYLEEHPAANIEVIKEYSDALVRCYTGTFSGTDSGEFNLIRIENSLYGLKKFPDELDSYWIEGTINTNLQITGTIPEGTINGQANGATLNGTWAKSNADSGTWTVERKL